MSLGSGPESRTSARELVVRSVSAETSTSTPAGGPRGGSVFVDDVQELRASRRHGSRRLDAGIAGILFFFMLCFAAWTVMHHAATFGGIPWRALKRAALWGGLPLCLACAWLSRRVSLVYAQAVAKVRGPPGVGNTQALTAAVTIGAVALVPGYPARYCVSLIGCAVMWLLATRRVSSTVVRPRAEPAIHPSVLTATLALIACTAIAVTLGSHRPDLDDASYLQIAAQTSLHPDRAPLTFDSSLGVIREPFRFLPYRVAAYETLVALVVDWTSLDPFTVYYLLLPALAAVLSVLAAYLLSRWFLSPGLAVGAAAAVVLILIAWGDTHYAFGSRVYVRLFQGKASLIALTTPMTIASGMLLLRQASIWTWLLLAAAHLAAVGSSSTGLICTFISTALILAMALRRDPRRMARAWIIVGSTLVYPALLSAWLELGGSTGDVPLSALGSAFPIDASLGGPLREALSLAGLALGIAALESRREGRHYALLVTGILALVFNPWLSRALGGVTAKDVSWRLAWAAPLPQCLGIAWVALMAPPLRAVRGLVPSAGQMVGVVALGVFLAGSRWTTARANGNHWDWPSAKVPPEYAVTRKIVGALEADPPDGAIWAVPAIGAWLPLTAPGMEQVMPGHTYGVTLRTILPKGEFQDRMKLHSALQNHPLDLEGLVPLLREFRVGACVVDTGSAQERYVVALFEGSSDVRISRSSRVAGYTILWLSRP